MLRGPSGAVGVGEALPLPTSGTEEIERTAERLDSLGSTLTGSSGKLGALLDCVDEVLGDAPAARCAADTALHDLEGQRAGLPVSRLLGEAVASSVPVNAVLGDRTLAETLSEARNATAAGYTTLKLKVGRERVGEDLERIAAVRDALASDVRLRLDANGAWSADTALEFVRGAEDLDLELIEQPVPADDLPGLARLARESTIPIALDETLALPQRREEALEGRLGSVVIVKPMVLGGLRESARLARAAVERGFRVVVTTTFEGPVGTAAALHLAAVVGDVRLASGLASADVIAASFPSWLVPDRGTLRCSADPGLGTEPPREDER
jgi:o-succinylbenzoate synthase